MKKKIALIFVFTFISLHTYAQRMTLKECLAIALKNNLTYRESQINQDASQADYLLAKSQRLPQINAYVGQSTNAGRSVNKSDNTYTNQLYNANSLGLQFSLPIFNGFQIQNKIEQTEFINEANRKSMEVSRNKLTINILQAYVLVLATQELADVARQQVESSKLQVERTSKQIAAGTVGESTIFELKSQLANDNFAYTTAKNNNSSARLALFQLMNQPVNRETTFEPIVGEILTVEIPPIQEIYEKALTFFPDIKSAEMQVHSFESLIKYTKGNTLPTVGMTAGYGTFYASSNKELNYFNQLDGNRSGYLSFNLNIPILGKMQNSHRVSAANVQKNFAENQLNSAKLQLIQAIEQANQALLSASERYTAATEQVEATEKSVAAAESRLNAGTAGLVEYSLAKTNYARAMANLVQAKYELIMQKKAMNYYQTGEIEI